MMHLLITLALIADAGGFQSIFNNVQTLINQLEYGLAFIAAAIAGLFLAYGFIRMQLAGQDQMAYNHARTIMVRSAMGLAGIGVIAVIVAAIQTVFGKGF